MVDRGPLGFLIRFVTVPIEIHHGAMYFAFRSLGSCCSSSWNQSTARVRRKGCHGCHRAYLAVFVLLYNTHTSYLSNKEKAVIHEWFAGQLLCSPSFLSFYPYFC